MTNSNSNNNKNSTKVSLLLLLTIVAIASGFAPVPHHSSSSVSTRSSSFLKLSAPPPSEEDFPSNIGGDADDSSVDWDAEWKKVVKNKDQPRDRPGTEFYKSDAEVSVTKVVNRAADTVRKTSMQIPPLSSLTGDWRFWIGILAFVSVASAVIGAPQDMASSAGPADSYYI
jgi:hypothetical protein